MWIAELFKEISEDVQVPERYPHWILFGIALAVILSLLFNPFDAL